MCNCAVARADSRASWVTPLQVLFLVPPDFETLDISFSSFSSRLPVGSSAKTMAGYSSAREQWQHAAVRPGKVPPSK